MDNVKAMFMFMPWACLGYKYRCSLSDYYPILYLAVLYWIAFVLNAFNIAINIEVEADK